MSLIFRPWTSPQGAKRVYVNGLVPRAPYFEQGLPGLQYSPQDWSLLRTKERAQAAGIADLTYEEALARCAETTPPIAPPQSNMQTYRAALEQAGIFHLSPAARMAGLSFRNGPTKRELIEKIASRGEETTKRVLEIIAQLKAGQVISGKTAPPKSDPSDWDDAPAKPETPAARPAAPVDLLAYAKIAWTEERLQREHAARLVLEQNLKGEIEALRSLRPIVMQFPERGEPVKLEGLSHEKLPLMIAALRAGKNVMLVGPAGSGKTFAAEQAAKALELAYYKQPPVNYAHEILGHLDAHNRYHRTPTRNACEGGGLLNLDEFDASSADAGLACNQVADTSSVVSFPDGMIAKHKDFRIVAGTNTDGSGATMQYAGRTRLDGATLNRFVLIRWDYDSRVEDKLGQACPEWISAVRAVRAYATQQQILDVCATMRDIDTGCGLLSGGVSRRDVLEMTQKRGALAEAWDAILRLSPVASFLKG